MRKLIALTLAVLACSTALAIGAYLNDTHTAIGASAHEARSPDAVPPPRDAGAETDNSRECSAEEGITTDCTFN